MRGARRSYVVLRSESTALADLRTAGHEQQPKLADLYLVSPGQLGLLDPLTVHVGAVEAANVANGEAIAMPVELGVPPGDRHVVEEDVAVRMPAGRGEVAVEQEPGPLVRPAEHDEKRRARRKRVHRGVIGRRLVVVFRLTPDG